MLGSLAIRKGMSNKEILGLLLREDLFLNMLAKGGKEQIRKVWQEAIGEDDLDLDLDLSEDEMSFDKDIQRR